MYNDCPICKEPLQKPEEEHGPYNRIRCKQGHYTVFLKDNIIFEDKCYLNINCSFHRGIGASFNNKYTVVWQEENQILLRKFRVNYIIDFNKLNSKEKIERLLLLD